MENQAKRYTAVFPQNYNRSNRDRVFGSNRCYVQTMLTFHPLTKHWNVMAALLSVT